MSNNILELPDAETLKKYWGTAEAYLEEQRRTASYNLEADEVAAELDTHDTSLLGNTPATPNRQIKLPRHGLLYRFTSKGFHRN